MSELSDQFSNSVHCSIQLKNISRLEEQRKKWRAKNIIVP